MKRKQDTTAEGASAAKKTSATTRYRCSQSNISAQCEADPEGKYDTFDECFRYCKPLKSGGIDSKIVSRLSEYLTFSDAASLRNTSSAFSKDKAGILRPTQGLGYKVVQDVINGRRFVIKIFDADNILRSTLKDVPVTIGLYGNTYVTGDEYSTQDEDLMSDLAESNKHNLQLRYVDLEFNFRPNEIFSDAEIKALEDRDPKQNPLDGLKALLEIPNSNIVIFGDFDLLRDGHVVHLVNIRFEGRNSIIK